MYAGGERGTDIFVRATSLSLEERIELKTTFTQLQRSSFVVECSYHPGTSRWVIKNFRHDKLSANFITTVFATLETIIDNVTQEELIRVFSPPTTSPGQQ